MTTLPHLIPISDVKFTFSEKATKVDKIFTINLTVCSKCEIYSEDFVNFCGLLRKHEPFHYYDSVNIMKIMRLENRIQPGVNL